MYERTDQDLELPECGVADLEVRAIHKQAFRRIGMQIELISQEPHTHENDIITLTFPISDLKAACVGLQHRINRSKNVHLRVTVNPSIGQSSRSSGSSPQTKIQSYLEPLSSVRGADQVEVLGPASPAFIDALIAEMCQPCMALSEVLGLAASLHEQGDKELAKESLISALGKYKDALQTLRRGAFEDAASDQTLIGGPLHGLTTNQARHETKTRLSTKIASIYLRLGRRRMARIYVERMYSPYWGRDDRGSPEKFPLDFNDYPSDEPNLKLFADLLDVAAQISLANGNHMEACNKLSEAFRFDPNRLDLEKRRDEIVDRMEAR